MRCSSRLAVSLCAGPLCALAVAAGSARAAAVTDVPDAAEPDDPLDANFDVRFEVMRHGGLITRENTQVPANGGPPRTIDVREMSYERFRLRLLPRLEVGVFHDLSVFLEWPVVLYEQTTFTYAQGTDKTNSTLSRDQAPNPSPTIESWEETEGSGRDQLVDGKYGIPAKPYNDWRFDHAQNGKFEGVRANFDNPTIGIRFSPVNNERDDTKPTITLQVDYKPPFPLGPMDPTLEASSSSSPGVVADGSHRFHFQVGMSKRYRILDPYFLVDYTLPFTAAEPGIQFGYRPSQIGGFTLGLEIVPYEDLRLDQRFALDVGASALYVSEGRDYSEVSDVLKEVTNVDQHLRGSVHAGLFFRPFTYVFISAIGSATYDTEHLLTVEDIGEDEDANGEDGFGTVDLEPEDGERNPFFNPVLDTPGRRLKIDESVRLQILIRVALTF